MTHLLATWGYLALVGVTLLAAMGLPTGSEIAIAFAGALASGKVAHAPHFNLVLVIVLTALAELAGSFFGYGIGRIGGRPLLLRLGRGFRLTAGDLDRCEQLLSRYGPSFVFFGRFVPLARSFVGIAAGLGRMAVVPYAVFTAIAVAIWCSALAICGDVLGRQWHRVLTVVGPIGVVSVGVIAVLAVTFGIRAAHKRRAPTERDIDHASPSMSPESIAVRPPRITSDPLRRPSAGTGQR